MGLEDVDLRQCKVPADTWDPPSLMSGAQKPIIRLLEHGGFGGYTAESL